MLDVDQLRKYIIKPALDALQMYSSGAEELLVMTCATESQGGTYLKQIHGPALGIYQMEPNTFMDLWERFIMRRQQLITQLAMHFNARSKMEGERMIYDLRYATAMARVFYRRVPDRIPDKDDIDGLWEYYKKHWNTEQGAATKDATIKAYKKFAKLKD